MKLQLLRNMDKILLLLLSITAALASPNCSEDEVLKCGYLGDKDWRGKTWPENETELDKACSDVEPNLDCQIAFVRRCPNSQLAGFSQYLIESKTLYGKLCVASDFRTKFLKNVPCLNHEFLNLYSVCENKFNVEEVGGFCAYNFAVLQCVIGDIKDKCGEDSVHVFNGLYKPLISLDKLFCKKDY